MIVTVSPMEVYALLILVVVLSVAVLRYWLKDHMSRAPHAKNALPFPFMQAQPQPTSPVVTSLIAQPVITGTMPVMADMNYQIVNVRFTSANPTNPTNP